MHRRKELSEVVFNAVHCHTLPATAIGSGRASLLHKTHCLLHALLLELGSISAVDTACQQITAFTTDLEWKADSGT